jgi:lysosomal Pro-X carboxypeptidase
MREAVNMWYNNTGDVACFFNGDPSSDDTSDGDDDDEASDGIWGYQYCAEMTFQFSSGSGRDVFWPRTFNLTRVIEKCRKRWDVVPDLMRVVEEFGDESSYESGLGNIFFANGDQDPWADYSLAGCGQTRRCAPGVFTWMIEKGAHHADLMFSTEGDPESLKKLRAAQLQAIRQWIQVPQSVISIA